MTTIFVSHASADDAVAREVVSGLRRRGVNVWIDHHDLLAGGDIAGRISDGLARSDAFLLLSSAASLESRWVRQEWSSAVSRHMEKGEQFPLLIGRLDATPLPDILRSMKTVDLFGDVNAGVARLCEGLVTDKRPLVWYFDDQPTSLEKFRDDHGTAFRFRGFSDAAELLPELMAAQTSGVIPDILLLDFYTAKPTLSAEEFDHANQAIATMIAQEKDLKTHVDAAWHPAGVDIVETVRRFYPPEVLPIAMHTQQGLILLRDNLMQQLEYLGVGWLIKNHFSAVTDRMVLEGIAREAGHTITRKRPHALIIDDNADYIQSFIARQRDYYDIETLSEVDSVMGKLAALEAQDDLPDIFLVDMYYPTGQESQELIDLANQKLRDFAQLEERTEALVRQSFDPLGLDLIRQIRMLFPPQRLPILVYSVSGLVTVGDAEFREVRNRGCGWLLKNRYDPRTEEVMIMGEILRAHAAAAAAPQRGPGRAFGA